MTSRSASSLFHGVTRGRVAGDTPRSLSDPFGCEQTNDLVAVCCHFYAASRQRRADQTWRSLCDVTDA